MDRAAETAPRTNERPVDGGSILITGARAPVALHAARLFHQNGWHVALADTPRHPIAAASKSCSIYHQLPLPRYALTAYGDAIEAILTQNDFDFVLPMCEEVFYLAKIWQERNFLPPLFAPDLSLLEEVHHKHRFIALCEQLALPAPRSRLLESRHDLAATISHCRALVYKPVWSRFADRVLIRPAEHHLNGLAPSQQEPWVAQDYLDGEELSAYAVARSGKLQAFGLYHSPWRAGKGAGIYFTPIEDPVARDFVKQFITKTGWTGQISFDLMRLTDGRVLPLECNPRATSGLHLFRTSNPFLAMDEPTVMGSDVAVSQTIKLAMWIYGLPNALARRKFPNFLAALRDAEEVMNWPGDPLSKTSQLRSFLEILALAARKGLSPQQASTHDIEWNGRWFA